MAEHRLIVRTEVLDQIVKSLMQSVTATTKRRRRLDPNTRAGREAAEEAELLTEGLSLATKAQSDSWETEGA